MGGSASAGSFFGGAQVRRFGVGLGTGSRYLPSPSL